jgi:hypothetical protein
VLTSVRGKVRAARARRRIRLASSTSAGWAGSSRDSLRRIVVGDRSERVDLGGEAGQHVAGGANCAGWLVIDLDGTLVTARSYKEGAAPTFKMGYGPLTELLEVSSHFSGNAGWAWVTVAAHGWG